MLDFKTSYKWTPAKWQRLIDSGVLEDESVELIEGEIYKMSPERADHAFYVGKIARILRSLVEPDSQAVVREAHPITLFNSEPEPDIVLARSPEYLYLQHHPYPEDIYLCVEVSRTTLNFDLNQKLALYAGAEIPQYWVFDLKAHKLTVFSQPNRREKRYDNQQEITEGENRTIAIPSFEQLSINNLDIWNFS